MKPYLSVVSVTRNDEHGGDPRVRTQHFIDCIAEYSRRIGVPTELVLVEWNPPRDRSPLADAQIFSPNEFFRARVVTVPHEIHAAYPHSEQLPLFQMIGKNVGVRRSSGDFILCTNIDILLTKEHFDFFKSGKMTRGIIYRANRYDIDPDIPNGDVDKRIEYARNHIIHRCNRWTLHDCSTLHKSLINHAKFPLIVANRVRRWATSGLPFSNFMACGDFTLMHRDNWFSLRGYLEIPVYSAHIDSLLMMSAMNEGMIEETLSDPVYHIDHKFCMTPEEERNLFDTLDQRGVPYLQWDQAAVFMKYIRKHELHGVNYNHHNWGMGNATLPERIFEVEQSTTHG